MDAPLGNFQIPKLVQHDIQLGTYSTSILTAHTALPSAQGSTCLKIQTTLVISLQNFEYILTLRTSITSTQVLAKYALRIQNNSPARRSILWVFNIHPILLIGILTYNSSGHVNKSL